MESLVAVAAFVVVQSIKGPPRVDQWTIFTLAESTGFRPILLADGTTES
jgi:hypothetical protein